MRRWPSRGQREQHESGSKHSEPAQDSGAGQQKFQHRTKAGWLLRSYDYDSGWLQLAEWRGDEGSKTRLQSDAGVGSRRTPERKQPRASRFQAAPNPATVSAPLRFR